MQSQIIDKLKEIVHRYDPDAEIILFGSRARGDFWEESDWDFLILTEKENIFELDKKIRSDFYEEIEIITFEVVQLIVRNKKTWEEDLWMTPLFRNINKEGLVV